MSDNTKIEWADATVNAINGCSVTSPGCTNCYAMRSGGRNLPNHPATGLTMPTKAGHVWTGEVRLSEPALLQPLKWTKPRRIFWNAHGDTFHDAVPDEWIDRVMAICALTPQHTHMILTKRSARMREYVASAEAISRIYDLVCDMALDGTANVVLMADGWLSALVEPPQGTKVALGVWPLPNVWLGISVENQTRADERIPDLLATPAAIRFISAEPLLGSVDINRWLHIMWRCSYCRQFFDGRHKQHCPGCGKEGGFCGSHTFNGRNRPARPGFPFQSGSGIDWVIAGGESGPDARPMHPDWARSLRDQCAAAGVAFHFKQWGEFSPCEAVGNISGGVDFMPPPDLASNMMCWIKWENGQPRQPHKRESVGEWFTPAVYSIPVGKKRAGRLLDGIEHNGMPGAAA